MPVLWDRSGTPIELPLLAGDVSGMAYAINDLGLIVGTSTPASGPDTAVIWR